VNWHGARPRRARAARRAVASSGRGQAGEPSERAVVPTPLGRRRAAVQSRGETCRRRRRVRVRAGGEGGKEKIGSHVCWPNICR